jgi:hypothetical protein
MSGVVQFQKAGQRLGRLAEDSPLVSDIVNALHYLGGQAHRDVVVECIAAFRRNDGAEPPRGLAQDVISAFHDHIRSTAPGPRLLSLPFGPESRRWGLSAEGEAAMRHRLRKI